MRKVNANFMAKIVKNPEKGGAWLAHWALDIEGDIINFRTSAWASAGSAKRWVKEQLQLNTPRKNIKWEDLNKDGQFLIGTVEFKRELSDEQ